MDILNIDINLIKKYGINTTDLLVYGYVKQRNEDGHTKFTRQEIATEIGDLTTSSVTKVIRRLKEKGLIQSTSYLTLIALV